MWSVPFQTRAETQQDGGLVVSATVLSPEETQTLFGLPLYDRGIQPVWLQVQNNQPATVRYALVGTDREYFSPYEVAYVHRKGYSKLGQLEMELKFYNAGMPRYIAAGEKRSGFVFTHAEAGTKGFNVDLFGARVEDDRTFTFFIDVPGFQPDHSEAYLEQLYRPDEIRDLTEDGLRSELASRDLNTRNDSGEQTALPINVVIVGEPLEVLRALIRAGWSETPRPQGVDLATAQYLDKRISDVLFTRNAQPSGERNELRFWLSNLKVEGTPVWWVQSTHYIGRGKGQGELDPDIDDASSYLVQNLWYSQALVKFGWVRGPSPSSFDEPRQSYDGREYFSSDVVAVMWLTGRPTAMLDVDSLEWDPEPR